MKFRHGNNSIPAGVGKFSTSPPIPPSGADIHLIKVNDFGLSNGVTSKGTLESLDPDLNVFGGCYLNNGNPPANYSSLEVVTDLTGETSDQVLRIVKDGDWEIGEVGCGNGSGIGLTRAELRLGATIPLVHEIPHGSSAWYGFKILFPSASEDSRTTFTTWSSRSTNRLHCTQIAGAGNSSSPELQLLVGSDKLQYISSSSITLPGETLVQRTGNLISIVSDRWYYIVMFFLRDWESGGILRMWATDDPVLSPLVEASPDVELLGPVAIRDKPFGFFKSGIYAGIKDVDVDFHVADFDEIRCGEGSALFSEMLPY